MYFNVYFILKVRAYKSIIFQVLLEMSQHIIFWLYNLKTIIYKKVIEKFLKLLTGIFKY